MLAMESENRVRIKFLVSLQPGLHMPDLQRLMGLSFSATRHHVEKLVKKGEIDRSEDGGYSRLYPAGTSNEDQVLFSLLRAETDRKLLASLLEEASLSPKRLCDLTGLAKSTVSEHLAHLSRLGIVRIAFTATRGVSYELTNPTKIRLRIDQSQTLRRKATGRFIELWDF